MTGYRFTIVVISPSRTRAFGVFDDMGRAEAACRRITKALESKGYMVAIVPIYPETSGVQVAQRLETLDAGRIRL